MSFLTHHHPPSLSYGLTATKAQLHLCCNPAFASTLLKYHPLSFPFLLLLFCAFSWLTFFVSSPLSLTAITAYSNLSLKVFPLPSLSLTYLLWTRLIFHCEIFLLLCFYRCLFNSLEAYSSRALFSLYENSSGFCLLCLFLPLYMFLGISLSPIDSVARLSRMFWIPSRFQSSLSPTPSQPAASQLFLSAYSLLAPLLPQISVSSPALPLSPQRWLCLWVSCSFFGWSQSNVRICIKHSCFTYGLILTCCSLLSCLLSVYYLKLYTLWVNFFFFSQYLCIFLEMITPNKLHALLYYDVVGSHTANSIMLWFKSISHHIFANLFFRSFLIYHLYSLILDCSCTMIAFKIIRFSIKAVNWTRIKSVVIFAVTAFCSFSSAWILPSPHIFCSALFSKISVRTEKNSECA